MKLLEGKKALVFGLANDKSIAYGIIKKLIDNGAEVAISYAGPILEKRVRPIVNELGIKFCEECDLSDDAAIENLKNKVEKNFGKIDFMVHAVAYAPKEALKDPLIETSRDAFLLTMNISVYTLISVCKAFEPLMNDNASVVTLTYYGGEKMVQNYNVMGVAKAALDASLLYLAYDLGKRKIRINSISAGPIRTLASSGIGDFRSIFNFIADIAPLGRTTTIDDCGNVALFLASDLSSNITGEVIHVDSGFNTVGIHKNMFQNNS